VDKEWELYRVVEQYDEAMHKHEVFREHINQFREASEAQRGGLDTVQRQLQYARKQAESAVNAEDRAGWVAEVESLGLDRSSQISTGQSLQEWFLDLREEFDVLEMPENNIEAMALEVRTLRALTEG
jgi:hypothetical protein